MRAWTHRSTASRDTYNPTHLTRVGRITWQPPATTSINDMRLFSERLTADWRKERIVECTGYVITGGALVHWGPCLLHGRRGEE